MSGERSVDGKHCSRRTQESINSQEVVSCSVGPCFSQKDVVLYDVRGKSLVYNPMVQNFTEGLSQDIPGSHVTLGFQSGNDLFVCRWKDCFRKRMGQNTNWDKLGGFRSPRKIPQYVDMGDFVWVTGGLNANKNEPSCLVESNQNYFGGVHRSKPILPDIQACIHHCSGKTGYFAYYPGSRCFCKHKRHRRTNRGWFSGSTSCGNGNYRLRSTEVLDKSKRKWIPYLDLPVALFGHHMCRIGQTKKVLVFGGDQSSLNFQLRGAPLKNPAVGLSARTWLYDFDSPALGWQVKPNMIRPLYHATGVTHFQSTEDGTDYVYAFGGRIQARHQGRTLTDIVRFNCRMSQWEHVGNLARPVYGTMQNVKLPHGHIMLEYPDRKSLAEFDPITNKIAEIARLKFAVGVSFNTNHTDVVMAAPIGYK